MGNDTHTRPPVDDEQTLAVSSGPTILKFELHDASLDAFEAEAPVLEAVPRIERHDPIPDPGDAYWPKEVDEAWALFDSAHAAEVRHVVPQTELEPSGHGPHPDPVDPATLRAAFDLADNDPFLSGHGANIASDDSTSDARKHGSTAAVATPPAPHRGFSGGIASSRVAPLIVPIDATNSGMSLRAAMGVVALVAIGVAIAVGSKYLPLTSPPSVAPPTRIATRSLPVAPLPVVPTAPPDLPSPPPPAAGPPPAPAARAESTPKIEKPLIVPAPAREPYLRIDRAATDVSTQPSPAGSAATAPRPPAAPAQTQSPRVADVEPSPNLTPPRPAAPQPAPITPQPPAVADAPPPSLHAAEPARSSAPVAPELSAVQRDEVEIRRLLDDYRQAYGRLDAAGAASLWPAVDVAALSRAFSTIASQDVQFQQCTLEVTGQRAAARCRGSLQYVARVGNTAPQSRALSWTFILDHSSGRWLINRVTAQ